jgi:hypothetical protein
VSEVGGPGRSRRRSAQHHDLAVSTADGLVVVEVELRTRGDDRLRAVLSVYPEWWLQRTMAGVLYVCRHDEQIGRIEACAERAMFPGKRLRVETVDTIRGWAQRRAPDRAQALADQRRDRVTGYPARAWRWWSSTVSASSHVAADS